MGSFCGAFGTTVPVSFAVLEEPRRAEPAPSTEPILENLSKIVGIHVLEPDAIACFIIGELLVTTRREVSDLTSRAEQGDREAVGGSF